MGDRVFIQLFFRILVGKFYFYINLLLSLAQTRSFFYRFCFSTLRISKINQKHSCSSGDGELCNQICRNFFSEFPMVSKVQSSGKLILEVFFLKRKAKIMFLMNNLLFTNKDIMVKYTIRVCKKTFKFVCCKCVTVPYH